MGTKTKKQISSNNMKNCKKSLWRYQQSHCRVCLKEKLLIIKLPNQDILLKKQARRKLIFYQLTKKKTSSNSSKTTGNITSVHF